MDLNSWGKSGQGDRTYPLFFEMFSWKCLWRYSKNFDAGRKPDDPSLLLYLRLHNLCLTISEIFEKFRGLKKFFFLEILYLFWRAVAPKLIKIGIVWYFSMKVEVMNFNRWFMHFSAQTIFSMWKMSFKKKGGFWPDLPRDRTYPRWPYIIIWKIF